jgi:hypothetical protein
MSTAGDVNEEQSSGKPQEKAEGEEGEYDKKVMDLKFTKHKSKDKPTRSKPTPGGFNPSKKTATPVNQKGKITKEQMLTAPHSPYFEVRVGQAVFLRQAANDEFAIEEISEAIKLYERALYHCDFKDSKISFEQTQEQKQSVSLFIN